MIKITFKNLERSQLARDIVLDKFEIIANKFPELASHKVDIFLFMDNSITKPGPDVFGIKIVVHGKKYGGLVVEKTNSNLYLAVDEALSVMRENLNKKGDKKRVVSRHLSRKQGFP